MSLVDNAVSLVEIGAELGRRLTDAQSVKAASDKTLAADVEKTLAVLIKANLTPPESEAKLASALGNHNNALAVLRNVVNVYADAVTKEQPPALGTPTKTASDAASGPRRPGFTSDAEQASLRERANQAYEQAVRANSQFH